MTDTPQIFIEDLVRLSTQVNEMTLNTLVHGAIALGSLDLATFLDYQELTQGNVHECLQEVMSE